MGRGTPAGFTATRRGAGSAGVGGRGAAPPSWSTSRGAFPSGAGTGTGVGAASGRARGRWVSPIATGWADGSPIATGKATGVGKGVGGLSAGRTPALTGGKDATGVLPASGAGRPTGTSGTLPSGSGAEPASTAGGPSRDAPQYLQKRVPATQWP